MYNANDVKAEFTKRGLTARKVCKKTGMKERTFYKKLNDGSWSLEEAKSISRAAGFDEPTATRLFLL